MRDWIRRSFKNRIFITVLLVTLVPMLLCDVFIMQISMRRSGDMLYAQAQSELDTAAGIIDSALDTVDGVTVKLSGSSVIRGALHRGRESDLLYQLMYCETENLNGFASIDVYDSDGARIYAGSLDSEAGSLPVYWGVLRAAAAARTSSYSRRTATLSTPAPRSSSTRTTICSSPFRITSLSSPSSASVRRSRSRAS